MSLNPKVQHYVPRFLLKNHATGKKDHLWAFDKQTARTFRSNVRNVAAESNFYDSNFGDVTASLEPALSKVESQARSPIDALCRHKQLRKLDQDDRSNISLFLAVQFLRTRSTRDGTRDLIDALRTKLSGMATSGDIHSGLMSASEEDVKTIALRMLAKAPEYVPHFLAKRWMLFSAPVGSSFFIGDNPVALTNRRDFGPYGNLGLAVPGIEIYVPLSSNLMLGLLSPEIVDELEEGVRRVRDKSILDDSSVGEIAQIGVAIDGGTTLPCNEENRAYMNSLQVMFASRFVFCADDDFALIRRMLRDDPAYARGRTFQVL